MAFIPPQVAQRAAMPPVSRTGVSVDHGALGLFQVRALAAEFLLSCLFTHHYAAGRFMVGQDFVVQR